MKKVRLIITVPSDDFCYRCDNAHPPCEHLDTLRSKSRCDLGFYGLRETVDGITKAPRCAGLPTEAKGE